MTKKEAIKVLRTESIELGGPAPSVCRFWEALDMAIAALRQQEHFREVTKKVEPLTNAQKIRAMSDEELCDLLDEWWCMGANNDERLSYADERLAWLQQPAGEEDKHEPN